MSCGCSPLYDTQPSYFFPLIFFHTKLHKNICEFFFFSPILCIKPTIFFSYCDHLWGEPSIMTAPQKFRQMRLKRDKSLRKHCSYLSCYSLTRVSLLSQFHFALLIMRDCPGGGKLSQDHWGTLYAFYVAVSLIIYLRVWLKEARWRRHVGSCLADHNQTLPSWFLQLITHVLLMSIIAIRRLRSLNWALSVCLEYFATTVLFE